MKLLKLIGADTMVCPLLSLTSINRGEIVKVDDSVADILLPGMERRYDMDLPHWEVQADDTAFTYDFSTAVAAAPVEPVAPAKTGLSVEDIEREAAALAASEAEAAAAAGAEGTEAAPKTQRVVRR